MSAYTHYTYVRSDKAFMITYHQGHREVQGNSEFFVLSDPAIHIAKMGEKLILDELAHSLDGNRRKDGVREFAEFHRFVSLYN